MVLEEDLELDCAPDGLLLLPRLPYLGGERLGTVIDMLLVGDQIGGYRPSCLPAEVRGLLICMFVCCCFILLAVLSLTWWWETRLDATAQAACQQRYKSIGGFAMRLVILLGALS